MGNRVGSPTKTVIFDISNYLRTRHLRTCALVPGVQVALSRLPLMELPVLAASDDYFLLPLPSGDRWMSKKALYIKEVLEA